MKQDSDHIKLIKMHGMAKRADEALAAEQRNNILVKAGKHYNNRSKIGAFSDTLRGKVHQFTKPEIRLTKNHIPRITNIYINAILDGNPSVTTRPYNKDEMSDNKSSELASSVLAWIKRTNKWKKKQKRFVSDYVDIGETFAKVSYDPTAGKPVTVPGPNGLEKIPSGEIVIDKAFGFDIKIDPSARDFEDARWLIHDSIVDLDEFKALVREVNPDMVSNIKPGIASGHHAFDAFNGVIKEVKDKVVIHELYRRPSSKMPNGEYIMFTKDFTVTKAGLPFGIWNWVYLGFDEMTTSARSTSIIKICRPYQIEINRSASKMAEHQITLGDDKVFVQRGTKLTNAGNMSGLRAYSYAGDIPTVMPGRSGAQYLEYQVQQIREMYEACNLQMITEDKQPQGDPYQMLYSSMKDKKRFSLYSTKYEDFEVEIFTIALDLAKKHLPNETAIKVLGRSEMINMDEFKRLDNDSFDFFIEPVSGDIETKFGEVLRSTSILQYAGSSLPPDHLGKLIKGMPFGRDENYSTSLTIKQDAIDNVILAMDRGEIIPVNEYDDHEAFMQAIHLRMTKSDFKFLDQGIQDSYIERMDNHTELRKIQLDEIAKSEQGLIPSGGFLTTINASWLNPATNRIERIKAPSQAVQWLMKKLEAQGVFLKEFSNLPEESKAQIGSNSGPQPQALDNNPQNNVPQA